MVEFDLNELVDEYVFDLYLCPQCNAQLFENCMGRKCIHCNKWLYVDDCKKQITVRELREHFSKQAESNGGANK